MADTGKRAPPFNTVKFPFCREVVVAYQARILAISQDDGLCSLVRKTLESEGHRALCVPSAHEAIIASSDEPWDLLLIDAPRNEVMSDLFLPELLRRFSSDKLCILVDPGDASWKGHAQRWRISRVLTKPLSRHDLEELIVSVDSGNCSPEVTLSSRRAHSPIILEELENRNFFLASSPAMVRMYKNIRVLATVDHPVLILGESGVGKEIVARLLHRYSARAEKKFINVNTAALPSELLESELFGYEAGAFTGAIRPKPGKFELADKGTLLLDEIGEMIPMMQAKLLHVLQDGTFSRLGSRSSTQVDVRILAATNVELEGAIAERRFREDLFYRLNAFTITVPSLRERREEIPFLIEQMMNRAAARAGQEPILLSGRLIEAAQEYHWPGNLRELRNFVTRIAVLQDQQSALIDLRAKTRAGVAGSDAGQVAAVTDEQLGMKSVVKGVKYQTESRMIKEALSAAGWNRRRAATNLNISYRALLYKIQQHGLRA